jgi:hypothetical protein
MFVKQNDNQHYILDNNTVCIVHSKIIEKYFCNTTLVNKMCVINNLLNRL